jgi:UDP-N-acetylmuramate--alanine ligase
MAEHVHFIGIGGTGLSAIARVLYERGISVSGSDQTLSPMAADLQAMGVQVSTGHQATNINGATLVVRSSAVPHDNVEVQAALTKGLQVLKRSDYLAQLMQDQTVLAVAGTHGKTTTTAMLAWIFSEMGLSPSFIVGGIVNNLAVNAAAGQGTHFIIEADEYDHMFLGLRPDIAVVTNVEHDHPDLFPTAQSFDQAFDQFAKCIRSGGRLIVCADDPGAGRFIERLQRTDVAISTYGTSLGADFRADRVKAIPAAGHTFDILHAEQPLARLRLHVPGHHNMLNALAAFAVAHFQDLEAEPVAGALNRFSGTGRRFDVRGHAAGVTVIDDYAHHPTEIDATIQAARDRYPGKRLWVVWQPHTYSRLNLLADAFAAALSAADHVIITDVYAAREQAPAGFTLDSLVQQVSSFTVQHISGLDAAAAKLLMALSPGDILLTLSAGDANTLSKSILAGLAGEPPPLEHHDG